MAQIEGTTEPEALMALLDELDAAREKATPGEWEKVGRYRIDAEGDVLARVDRPDDAACIAAEHNAVPKLTAALRAVLDLADELGRVPHIVDPLVTRVGVARRLRSTIAAALTPEQVQP